MLPKLPRARAPRALVPELSTSGNLSPCHRARI